MPRCDLAFLFVLSLAVPMTAPQAAEPVRLYAAGSLRAALSDLAGAYEAAYGVPVTARFGPSGLLREAIEGGETPEVFASANMTHPQALAAGGKGGPVVLFARNKLCALAQPDVAVASESLLAVMRDPAVRLGTSTPRADPSGDYAWQVFAKADASHPGAKAELEAKALQLTGGPDSEKAPEGRNTYAWVMEKGRADLFLTYCTNAVLAKAEVPALQIVALPQGLEVGADYGLIVLDGAGPAAWRFALYVLSPDGQALLARYGFAADGQPESAL